MNEMFAGVFVCGFFVIAMILLCYLNNNLNDFLDKAYESGYKDGYKKGYTDAKKGDK